MSDAGSVDETGEGVLNPEGELSPLDRTRAEYTGIEPGEEFQPVDEVELAEEGLLLDDPEALSEGHSQTDGDLDPDDVGWDLDAQE